MHVERCSTFLPNDLDLHRMATGELAAAQSRVDLLGVAVSSLMVLTALSRADIQVPKSNRRPIGSCCHEATHCIT